MWELGYNESSGLKNWCFWTLVLEKTLESLLGCKEINPNHPKGDQYWVFIGSTDAEAETPILWPPDAKNWLIGKDPDAGKDWRQEEKGTTEDEMVGWHHWLNGHEFEQGLGVGDGQGRLACCSPWSRRVGHNWGTKLNWRYQSNNSMNKSKFLCLWVKIRSTFPETRLFWLQWMSNKLPQHKWFKAVIIYDLLWSLWVRSLDNGQ